MTEGNIINSAFCFYLAQRNYNPVFFGFETIVNSECFSTYTVMENEAGNTSIRLKPTMHRSHLLPETWASGRLMLFTAPTKFVNRGPGTDVFDSRTPTGSHYFGIVYCLKGHERKTASSVRDFFSNPSTHAHWLRRRNSDFWLRSVNQKRLCLSSLAHNA